MYSNKHLTTTITPIEGPNAGKTIVVLTRTTGEFDPNQKTTYGKGSGGTIAFIAEGTPEPSLKIACSSGEEATRVTMLIGRSNRCTISCVFASPTLPTLSYRMKFAKISKGGGWKSDDAAGVSGDLEFMMQQVDRKAGAGAWEKVV